MISAARRLQWCEQRLIPERVAQSAVEAFYETVRHRLAGRDVGVFDLVLGAPLHDRVQGPLGPVVRQDHAGLAAAFDQRGQLPRHTAAHERPSSSPALSIGRTFIADGGKIPWQVKGHDFLDRETLLDPQRHGEVAEAVPAHGHLDLLQQLAEPVLRPGALRYPALRFGQQKAPR